jgi:hypothetical protein
MYATLKCKKCGTEVDKLVPNSTRIGAALTLEDSDPAPCECCAGREFVRILQTSITRHGSWTRW